MPGPFYAEFVTPNVVQVHRLFNEVIAEGKAMSALARRLGVPNPMGREYDRAVRAYVDWNRELDALAKITAADATAKIRTVLKRTQKRPENFLKPNLRDLIKSVPLPRVSGFATGAVGIGLISELDKAVDPHYPGDGPYWRAQEYGSAHMVGRAIRGFFYGPRMGNPLPPQSPPPTPLQPIFIPSQAANAMFGSLGFKGDSGGGVGIVQNPIMARHFLEIGTSWALADWRIAQGILERRALKELGV